MIHVRIIEVGPIATNVYLVHDDHGSGFLIDPGYEYEKILAAMTGVRISHILLTHAHCDHIGGLARVREATQAHVLIHEAEATWLTDPELNLSAGSPFAPWPVRGPQADTLLTHGARLTLLGEEIEVRHTPGHSPGHVSYVMGDVVFGGDALFSGSIGRTDLPGGNHETLLQSIREQLLTLPPETNVLPGHGPPTTVAVEARSNPFLA